MATLSAAPGRRAAAAEWLFPVAVFASAGLVFSLEPMIARLLLPRLGGSPAVWNASLAFFQVALLVGYVYAHLLQRIDSLRVQVLIHLCVLTVAALSLPVRVTDLLGEPPAQAPAPWLLGVLALSIGGPFAALAATAPLVQAWRARGDAQAPAGRTWGLYAASNFGSLAALLAYPTLIEPGLSLTAQAQAWTVGYVGFCLLTLALGAGIGRRRGEGAPATSGERAPAPRWVERARWVVLAAIPSSLLVGVTSFVATDIASAPFLWTIPLALYLVSFIVAFQERPAIPREAAMALQAVMLAAACAMIDVQVGLFLMGAAVHFAAFFLTALVCCQALTSLRPPTSRLTDFYICLSLGGALGGAFNAFVAPLAFSTVVEYPAVLALSALVRPWGRGRAPWTVWAILALCAVTGLAAAELTHPFGRAPSWLAALGPSQRGQFATILLVLTAGGALALQGRAPFFFVAVAILVCAAGRAADRVDVIGTWRDFFGVLRESRIKVPALGGPVHMLANGTTLHGAEAVSPAFRCHPIVYYAPEAPIGQVMRSMQARRPTLQVGVVGLGTGAMAAYDRAGDGMRFFEIDPLVVRVASDRRNFAYLKDCAKGRLAVTLGDARLSLARTPERFDILVIDAFSSDSVPAHLLTVEAMRLYLARLRPGGVLVLHLSNRNLDLMDPAQAAVLATGGAVLAQRHRPDPKAPPLWESPEDAVIAAQDPATLAPFAADARWTPADAKGVAPWTDDHTDLFGALARRVAARWRGELGA